MEQMLSQYGEDTVFLCIYGAGALGYRLYHQLNNCGVACVIMGKV